MLNHVRVHLRAHNQDADRLVRPVLDAVGAVLPSGTRHNRTDRKRPRTVRRSEDRASCDNDDEFFVRVMNVERRNLSARSDLVERRTQALCPSLHPDRCHAVEEGGQGRESRRVDVRDQPAGQTAELESAGEGLPDLEIETFGRAGIASGS